MNDVDSVNPTSGFSPGETSGSCSFTISDDNIAEANESFVIHLRVLSGDGEVSSPSEAQLTILANDNAHGVISFLGVSIF